MVTMPAAGNLLDFLDFLGAVEVVVSVAAAAGLSEGSDPAYRKRLANRSDSIAGAERWFQLSFGDLKCLGQKRGA